MSTTPPQPSTPDRDTLARIGLPLARRIAATHGRKFPPLADEFESAAYLGLAQAIDRFEPGRGFAFATFATRRIWGAILDAQRKANLIGHSRKTGSPRIISLDEPHDLHDGRRWIRLADMIASDEDGPDVLPTLDAALDYGRFLSSAVHRSVLRRLYGHADTATMRATGEHMGISMSRVSQLHGEAIALIRGRLGLDGWDRPGSGDSPESPADHPVGRGLRLAWWHRAMLRRLAAERPGETNDAIARRFAAEAGTPVSEETVRRYRMQAQAKGGAA